MKVYFLSNRYQGCYYLRCMLPALHNNWDGARKFLTSKVDSPEVMLEKALQADIVVFQRPDTPDKTEAIRLLKKAGKKIVFDNDDTYLPNSGFPKLELERNKQFVEKINEELYKNIKQADLVTTTTKTLAMEYKMMNDNIVVLPNTVDPFDWDEPIRNETNIVRIGLVGSVGYDDYKVIKPYLEELSARDDVQIVMFGMTPKERGRVGEMYQDSYKFIDSNNIEWVKQVPMHKYNETLNSLALDLMLIPRRDTYFNKCKSNVKYLEASMCEIPVVASSFENSPYEELDGDNGFKASDTKKFKYYTEKLINDKALRRQIGKNAKEYVLKNYNIEDLAPKWAEAYQKIYDKNN